MLNARSNQRLAVGVRTQALQAKIDGDFSCSLLTTIHGVGTGWR